MATIRSGTIVFMKNDEKTRTADNQPATTINMLDLDFGERRRSEAEA
jgi:hypothetical protein